MALHARLRGGVYALSTVTIGGGRISGNTAATTGLDTVEVADDTAQDGGGLAIEGGTLRVVSGTVVRNTASRRGGGAQLVNAGVLQSITSDWGTDADDNVPGDVFAGTELVGYGAGATFECVADACTPTP